MPLDHPLPPITDLDPQQRFLRLFLTAEREVFRYVSTVVPHTADAQDIVQQTALALWRKFDKYDPALPFTPWACRFALLEARRWSERRRRWKVWLDSALAEDLLKRRQELLPEMETRFRHLDECVAKLPADRRRLVEAYYFQRTPAQQLANEFGQSIEAIYKSLQRIRDALRDCIEGAARAEERSV